MSDFEKKLSEKLDHPITDPNTGAVLEAEQMSGSYADASKRGQVSDKLYEMYTKYVGKLNALPQVELVAKELIDPRTGGYFPFTSWPTKESRAAASAKWDAYNQKLQQRTDPEGTKTDPCADPEAHLQQTMRDCMAMGQGAGKCKKQVDKLRAALHNYCK